MSSSVAPVSLPSRDEHGLTASRGPDRQGFGQFWFADEGIGHPVYQVGGRDAPIVLLLQELPGLGPGLLAFAERLAAQGFQVYLPWLFGPFNGRSILRNYVGLCISREFARLAEGVSAPITRWLRALVSHVSVHNGKRPVAAIGMCVTGGFAIPLLLHPDVKRAVAAQPSIPMSFTHRFLGRHGGAAGAALNVSADDIAAARDRLTGGEARLLAVRCVADRLCPREKLARLEAEFPVGLIVREYGSATTRNANGERPHATYTREGRLAPIGDTEHYAYQAFDELLAFLRADHEDAQTGSA